MTFTLIDSGRNPLARLDIVLSRDLASLELDHANVALADRDQLRAWAATERTPLHRHEVVLTRVEDWIALVINELPPAWITPPDVLRLLAVL